MVGRWHQRRGTPAAGGAGWLALRGSLAVVSSPMAFQSCTTQATPLRLLLLLLLLAVRLRGVTPHAAGCPRSRAASALAAHGCVAALPRTTSGECTDRQSRPAAIQVAQQQRVSNTHTAAPEQPPGRLPRPAGHASSLAGLGAAWPVAAPRPHGLQAALGEPPGRCTRLIMRHDAQASRPGAGQLPAADPAGLLAGDPLPGRPLQRLPHGAPIAGALTSSFFMVPAAS